MVDTALPKVGGRAKKSYAIERLTDPAHIRSWLEPERAYAAYALGQLEPALFQYSKWWSARGPKGRALVLVSRGGLGNALVTLGDAEALDALLSLHPGPRFAFAIFRPEHLPVAQRYYSLIREELMLRMTVSKESVRSVEGETSRLSPKDLVVVNRLYSTEDGPSYYAASNLEDGTYYGVFVDKRLVSIAGTHVVAPSEGIAVVGNVFTHPNYRGRGLATIATSAVTRALLESCPQVLLTVESSNFPALRVYGRLGYREVCTLYETPVVRREPSGLLSLGRRLLAGRRGRRQGIEVIRR